MLFVIADTACDFDMDYGVLCKTNDFVFQLHVLPIGGVTNQLLLEDFVETIDFIVISLHFYQTDVCENVFQVDFDHAADLTAGIYQSERETSGFEPGDESEPLVLPLN